jgi:hypothetical protein
MILDRATAEGIGVALNEASLLGVEYDPEQNLVATTFSVLTLANDADPAPSDPRRQLVLTDVGRIAAALRDGDWNDFEAPTIPFQVSELLAVVQSFGAQPVYGWEFVNTDDPGFSKWQDRLSLDVRPSGGSTENRLSLFQEGDVRPRHLDLWIWFSEMHIRDAQGGVIPMEDFIVGGQRWWDALFAKDPRTQGRGIFLGEAPLP